MAIVGTLPVQLANGTLADATQVMSDFNYISAQVNTNAAGLVQANNFIGAQTIAGDIIVTVSAAQTLTNKTISASGNLGTTGTGTVDLSVSANITGVAGIAIGVNNSASTNGYGIVAGAAYLAVAAGTLNAPLVFGTTNTERMRIDTAGKVGIGKTPIVPLDVSSVSGGAFTGTTLLGFEYQESGSGNGKGIGLGYDTAAQLGTIVALSGGPSSGLSFVGYNAGWAERMRLDSAGNLGIGAGATTSRLSVGVITDTTNIAQVNCRNAGLPIFSANASGAEAFQMMVNNSGGANIGLPTGTCGFGNITGFPIVFALSGTERMRITNAGTIQDGAGLELGYKGLPNTISNNYVDRGKACALTAGTTVNTGVFNAGDTIVYYNDSAAAITITQGASVTLRLAGTTLTGNRTMAPRAFATLWYKSTSEVIMTGAGVS